MKNTYFVSYLMQRNKHFNLFVMYIPCIKCKYDHIDLNFFACMYTIASLDECIKHVYLKL